MLARTIYCFAFAISLGAAQVGAQEAAPTPGAPGQNPAGGANDKYADLAHSKDPKTKGVAERYLNLIKFQEWTTASGKAPVAKYLSHDADLKHVKLGVAQGSGKDRVVKEFNLDVNVLSKSSQSRLKQIDFLQKKLD